MSATEQSIEQQGGGGTDLFERIVLVDDMFGNDATAIAYNQHKPFKTINAAKAVAVTGDTVVVNPGNYTVTSQLAKNGVNYYFEPNAIVFHTAWILDDVGHIGDANTKVFGHGTFTQPFTFAHGVVNLTAFTTDFTFHFDTIDGSAGANFAGTSGRCNVRGNLVRNGLQYVVQGYNDCVWDFDVARIENINATAGATFELEFLVERVAGQGSQSIFKSNYIENNAFGSFGTVTVANTTAQNHKVVVKANIIHNSLPIFLSAVLSLTRGGAIEFEGQAKTNVQMVTIFGDFNLNVPNTILINDSLCVSTTNHVNRPGFGGVNNENHWLTIKDSLIIVNSIDAFHIGAGWLFGDTENGNLELINTVVRNIFDDAITPTKGISTAKIGGKILLNNVVFETKTAAAGSYSIGTIGLNLPQSVSVLNSITTTSPVEPVNVLNDIVGTSIFVTGLPTLTNPLIN